MSARKCPSCGQKMAEASGSFCSERCRLVDLSGWLGERYRIPGPEPVFSEPFLTDEDGEILS